MAHPQQFLMSSPPSLFWIATQTNATFNENDSMRNCSYRNGYLYVCGNLRRTSGVDDAYVGKYNEYGQPIWERYVSVGSGWYGYAYGIDADDDGNVYVSVGRFGSPFYQPAFIVKFNSSGTLQWQRAISTGYWYTYTYDLQCDSSGNVYASGYVNPTAYIGNDRMYVVKFDTSGNLQWTKTYGPNGNSTSIFVERVSGDIYTSYNNKVSQFNSSGTLQGTIEISGISPGTGSSGDPQGAAVCCVDSSGNIYVAGRNASFPWTDTFLFKLNSSGTIQWQKKSQIAGTDLHWPNGIGIDANGDVYICGLNFYRGTSEEIGFAIKYQGSNGNLLWKREFESEDIVFWNKHIPVIDNNLYLVGTSKETGSSQYNALITKFPADGSLTGTYGNFTWKTMTTTTDSNSSFTSSTPSISFGTLGSSSSSSLTIGSYSPTQSIQYLV